MLFGREHVDRYVATDGEEGYVWPDYDAYQRRAEREIPVVILTRD